MLFYPFFVMTIASSSYSIDVPMDLYQSAKEILIILPLGWVQKDSISIQLVGYELCIRGIRNCPVSREQYVLLRDQCFRWEFEKKIELPELLYFDKMYSELSPENILTIVIPKVLIPESIPVVIK